MVERLRMGMAVGMSSMRRAVPFSGGRFAGLRRKAANLSASSIHFVHLFSSIRFRPDSRLPFR